jgi:hypothetical protein
MPSGLARCRGCAWLAPLLLCAPAYAGGFQGITLAGRLGFDAGSLSVPDTGHGFGGGVALRSAFGDERKAWELGAELDVAGYTGSGDGDPLFQLALTLARRSSWGASGFWRAGAGAGLFGVGADAFALPLGIGMGIDLAPRSGTSVELMVFERLTLAFSDGTPGVDYVNTLGVELALRFGRRRIGDGS